MSRLSAETDNIAAATRGLIVQRLIVDGWSAAEAAASFGVSEQQVERWVTAYRRHGMASLRDGDAPEFAPARWARGLGRMVRQIFGEPGRDIGQVEPAPLVMPRRPGDNAADRRRSS